MLYLLKLDNAYKIGFTDSLEKRLKTIFATHVDCKLISTKLGSSKDEKELHKLCSKYFIKNELFEINSEVETIFNTYVSNNLISEFEKLQEAKEFKSKYYDSVITIDVYKNKLESIIKLLKFVAERYNIEMDKKQYSELYEFTVEDVIRIKTGIKLCEKQIEMNEWKIKELEKYE